MRRDHELRLAEAYREVRTRLRTGARKVIWGARRWAPHSRAPPRNSARWQWQRGGTLQPSFRCVRLKIRNLRRWRRNHGSPSHQQPLLIAAWFANALRMQARTRSPRWVRWSPRRAGGIAGRDAYERDVTPCQPRYKERSSTGLLYVTYVNVCRHYLRPAMDRGSDLVLQSSACTTSRRCRGLDERLSRYPQLAVKALNHR
jgi:hypothetical protein